MAGCAAEPGAGDDSLVGEKGVWLRYSNAPIPDTAAHAGVLCYLLEAWKTSGQQEAVGCPRTWSAFEHAWPSWKKRTTCWRLLRRANPSSSLTSTGESEVRNHRATSEG